MKGLGVFVLLLTLATGAHSITNAPAGDKVDIENKIREAKQKEADIEKVARLLKNARDAGDSRSFDTYTKRIATLRKERELAYNQAIWRTLRAYDIIAFADADPILPRGTSFAPSPERGKELTWIPVFEDKRPYQIQNESGDVVITLQIDDAGNTASDGVSRIFPEAFISPVELASLLFHELTHFELITHPIQGRTLTPGQREVAAYAFEQKLLDDGPLIFSSAERKRQKRYVAENLAKRNAQVRRELAEKTRGGTPPEARRAGPSSTYDRTRSKAPFHRLKDRFREPQKMG